VSEVFRDGLLDGQVVLLSGGGSGIGRVTALELASLGATVVVCGRRAEPLQETCALDPSGRTVHAVCDVREPDQVDALVDGVLADHGRLDVLVNNAGGQFLAPAEQISPKGFSTVVRLNLESTWLMTHAAATKAFIPGGGGKVVSITLTPHGGLPGMAHSSAARAGVENLMQCLGTEWARFGIRLNAVAVGTVATETLLTKYPQPVRDAFVEKVPLGRLGRPEEVAWAVAHLCSPAGDWTTGSVITIDGGRDNHTGPWPPPGEADEHGVPLAEARRTR
jgi:citronellol/citronellal dehydrogenase